MKNRIAIPSLILLALCALGGLYLTGKFQSGSVPERSGEPVPENGEAGIPNTPEGDAVTLTNVPSSQAPADTSPVGETPMTGEEVWKERLHTLLNNDTYSDRELGRQLLAIVEDGNAPEVVRVHAMANALNFTDDENYGEDVQPLALRADLPEAVNDVILDDLINRDPEIILPVAREFVKLPRHPLAGAIEAFVQSEEEKAAQ